MTELHVERTGDGPPMVLLHGFTGAIETMAGLRERLDPHHWVTAVDLVGHGRSPVPDDPAAYTVDAMATDVAEVIGSGSAHIVGYSMGGRVALSLACNAPERVRSLALIGASPGIADAVERSERSADDERLADRIESDGLERFVDGWMANPLFASQQRLGPDFLAAARDQRMRNSPLGLANSLRAGGTGAMTPLHARLADCRAPTRLIVGGLDTKFRGIAVAMDQALPVSSIVVVPDAGHGAHLEQSALVADAIRDLTA